MDNILLESHNFYIKVPMKPHIPKEDGGHIYIEPKIRHLDRFDLTKEESLELSFLEIVAGRALMEEMNSQGIQIYRINFQDNGNWPFLRGEEPKFHVHIYGRAVNEKKQEFGQALYFPDQYSEFYNDILGLNEEDINNIKERIVSLADTDYSWGSYFVS